LLAAIATALALPEDQLPDLRERRELKPSPALVALLKVLLAAKSEEHQVAGRLLASSDDLDRIATEEDPPVPALSGWRREVFGDDALALKAGRISLGVAGKKVKLIRAP
jgi:ribonuclease D